MISAEYAWVAGLFEGEGSVIVARKGQHQRRLDIANCQADVLERVREITGRGAVRIDANPNRPPHHQVRLVWQVWSWLDICEVADHIYPLLGVRRRERIRDLFAWPPSRMLITDAEGRRSFQRSPRPPILTENADASENVWIAWAAGLFEGEGSAVCSPMGGRRRGLQRRLQVPMSDRDVLDHLRVVLNAGSVRPVKAASHTMKGPRKQMFVWTCGRWTDIVRICNAILPWLGERRRAQVQRLLANPAGRAGWADKTQCMRGHPLVGPDAHIYRYGNARVCKACHQHGYAERIGRRRASGERAMTKPGAVCKRGHPLDGPGADVYVYFGWRQCRRCARESRAKRSADSPRPRRARTPPGAARG